MIEILVKASEAGGRLDVFVASQLSHLSRSRVQDLIRTGQVLIGNQATRPRQIVRAGDAITVHEPAAEVLENTAPEAIPLQILHEDEDLLVLNKSAGLVVHPGAGNREHTLVNALLHHCPTLSGIGGKQRPGIVHRLDKETSGCLVVAKHDAAHQNLAAQFAGRTVTKVYLALVAGVPKKPQGVIEAPIARHPAHRRKMAVVLGARGRVAKTEYRVRTMVAGGCLIECTLHSGRTHQIRVHLQHIGHPVLGDKVYATRPTPGFARHMLHAWKLGFAHPRDASWRQFEAPLPADFRSALP